MVSTKSFIQFCIAATIALLPVAHLKFVLFGIPLYSVEAPILVALVAYLYGWKQGTFSLSGKMNFRDPLIIGAALFFLGAATSLVANPFSLTGLGMLKSWFVVPLLMVWLLFQLQPNEREKNFILHTWLVVTLIVACGALGYAVAGYLTFDGRLAAWFGSPNYLAIFIAPGVLIVLHKLQKALGEKEFRTCLSLTISLIILLLALYFTRSYGVWLGVFSASLLMVLLSAQAFTRKHFWKILGVVIVVIGIFFFFESNNPKWQSLVSFEERSSLASRMMIWQSAGKMIADNPILGIGLGRFQEVYLEYQKYFPLYLEWAVPEPHNLYLAVWLQTGLLGLIGFVLFIVQAIFLLIKNKSRESVLLLGLLALYLIYGLFDTPFFKTDLAFVFWFVIGLILTFPKPEMKLRTTEL